MDEIKRGRQLTNIHGAEKSLAMTSPLRIGAVGLGRLGRFHAETIATRLPDTELTAVCSVTPEELVSAKNQFPKAQGYADYSEMLNSERLDAVVLTSPSALHCSQLLQAVKAGLHVFTEKPLGIKIEECQNVVQQVSGYPDRTVMVGYHTAT